MNSIKQLSSGPYKITAYVNHSRWICDCPICNSALAVKLLEDPVKFPLFGCWECGFGVIEDFWRQALNLLVPLGVKAALDFMGDYMLADYELPVELDEIESILLQRPNAKNRNWKPGESIEKLAQENYVRGIEG